MGLLLTLIVFALGAGAVIAVYLGATSVPAELLRRRVEARISEVHRAVDDEHHATVVKRQKHGPFPALDRVAIQTFLGYRLAKLIEQAGLRMSISAVILGAMLSSVAGAMIAVAAFRVAWIWLAAAALGFSGPFAYLRYRRSARMKKFEEQFPEALDLMSRAIRAGHAFTAAMGMVAEEGMDPVGPEFRKSFDEQNFGLPLKDALNGLFERVPLLDVRFFVTAVLIQRETGGNLAEILDNLAHVVRERFKILRQVRVYTAHGRFTGWVLLALPPLLAMALMLINPDHMNLLFRERMGQMMLGTALVMQTVGYFWIRKVIKIEV